MAAEKGKAAVTEQQARGMGSVETVLSLSITGVVAGLGLPCGHVPHLRPFHPTRSPRDTSTCPHA